MPEGVGELAHDLIAANDGSPLATTREAADLVRCHRNTIMNAIYRGELPCTRRAANGPITILVRDLAAWILQGRQLALPTRKRRR